MATQCNCNSVPVILGPCPDERSGAAKGRPSGLTAEFVRFWVDPSSFGESYKMAAHCKPEGHTVAAVERLLSPDGPFWMSRLVWAGEHNRPEYFFNDGRGTMMPVPLYDIASEERTKRWGGPLFGLGALQASWPSAEAPLDSATVNRRLAAIFSIVPRSGATAEPAAAGPAAVEPIVPPKWYLVNHDKRVVAEARQRGMALLPLLTAELGCECASLTAEQKGLCGIWARDTVSVETFKPEAFADLVV